MKCAIEFTKQTLVTISVSCKT
uniref:Uncharacterized protein n=1 Tax=Amphimedon queenslandica TaxID=400682 RepID=A0A1X7V9U0_AMPQE